MICCDSLFVMLTYGRGLAWVDELRQLRKTRRKAARRDSPGRRRYAPLIEHDIRGLIDDAYCEIRFRQIHLKHAQGSPKAHVGRDM